MCELLRTVINRKLAPYIKQTNVQHCVEILPKCINNGFGATITLSSKDHQLQNVFSNIQFDRNLIDVKQLIPSSNNIVRYEVRFHSQEFINSIFKVPSSIDLEANSKLRVVVEFSSPNIAKPFHVGHLRSTIIGNYIGQLYRHFGYNVINLNFLGDWGTQMCLLQVGLEMINLTKERIQEHPIESFYQAYVAANKAAESDPFIKAKARQYFVKLEKGLSPELSKQLEKYRLFTISELKHIYLRLGVNFDCYDWESRYSQSNIMEVLERLSKKSLLFKETDGLQVVEVDGERVPVIKNDGSTLYLARDIAALEDRFHRFHFDHIFYVVDSSQTRHLSACFKTTAALCDDLHLDTVKHVPFGRIIGMSTRKGDVVFLRDILDEAKDIMYKKQLQSSTTKISLSDPQAFEKSSDILGISAVIINDLKRRRRRDYKFDWNNALQIDGDTGIKLQYTHCRLFNLLKNVSHVNVDGLIPNEKQLTEIEAQDLLLNIAYFEQNLWKSKERLEPYILVNYLFSLCNSTSRALKCLHVKNERSEIRQQARILLFRKAKETLWKGMQILGLIPLTKM